MQSSRQVVALCCALLSGLILAGCATTKVQQDSKSLYQRIGGKDAIIAVVEDFVAQVAADERINGHFANTDIPRLKQLLVEQICAGTGGPCTYTGRDMKTVHAGRNITEGQFNALVEDLATTLDKFKVPLREKNELLGILAPMKRAIVSM